MKTSPRIVIIFLLKNSDLKILLMAAEKALAL